jgi:hypothetical protein
MGRNQKLALAFGVLLLLALAAWMALRGSPSGRCGPDTPRCDTSAHLQPEGWMRALGGLLETPAQRAPVRQGRQLRVAGSGFASFDVAPAADGQPPLRTLRLRLVAGGPATLRLRNLETQGQGLAEQERDQSLPDGGRSDPRALSYAIGKAGARLAILCQSPCTLVAE